MSVGRPEMASGAWRRVVAWCAERAPVTAAALHGPADDDALATVQRDLGQVWPEDLVAWLRVSDGAERTIAGSLIPWMFRPSPTDSIRDDWRMLTDIASEVGDPADLVALQAEPAGSRAHLFLRSWVPIADDTGGNWLFVDLRPGELHGCVGRWWHDDGFHGPDYGVHFWASVADMAQNLADALETGRWAPDDSGEQDMVPAVVDGVLDWEDADDEETLTSDTC
jgi:cell wall assembly regulator SMI1